MSATPAPSPALFFETINAYQRTAALKAALALGVFTALDPSPGTAAELAGRCRASLRGIRILCDYLVILGFLSKSDERYTLTADSAVFLSQKSPAYAGGAAAFLGSPQIMRLFEDLAEVARRGARQPGDLGTLAPEHPLWLHFARGMGPLMRPAAQALAALLSIDPVRPTKILDVSASHGAYGLAFLEKFPRAELVALDWAPVLAITRENAIAAGVGDRVHELAGDAFAVEFGRDYDAVLIPNFLHHFDVPTCVLFLRKVHAALKAGGSVAIVEFVPNADRVTPPEVATFSLVMLGTTPQGDAYTFAELASMLLEAGFVSPTAHPLAPSTATAVVATC